MRYEIRNTAYTAGWLVLAASLIGFGFAEDKVSAFAGVGLSFLCFGIGSYYNKKGTD